MHSERMGMTFTGTPADAEMPGPGSVSPALLDQVDAPAASAAVALSSGRRYEISARPEGDRLIVRSRKGEVLLRVLMTEQGPVLSFESAEIEVAASRRLTLSADEVSIEARRSLATTVAGDCTETIAGSRHTRIAAEDRLEAAAMSWQANERGVDVRAMGKIALDGEHIGLNDDPCPMPFSWSEIAEGRASTTNDGSGEETQEEIKS